MSRRGSGSESFSSSSDVNFDDLDDQQVFGFLEDDDDTRLSSPGSRSRSPSSDFRLDFSSRISASLAPPPPKPAVIPSKPVARKSVATSKPRSPSFTAKKPKVKRPSSLSISTPTSKLFLQKEDPPENSVRPPSEGSDSITFLELAAPAMTTSIEVEGSSGERQPPMIKAPSITLKPKLRKTKSIESSSTYDVERAAVLGSSSALVGALASLQAQVEMLTSEKTQLEADATTTRTTTQTLEQKLAAAEQSSNLLAQQLANVKESFQAKLLAREEEISLEKMTLAKERETQLQQQQARFTTEAELWKHEIASLTKVKLELQSENDRLHKELSDEVLQRGFAEAKHCALKTEHGSTREELQMLLQERDRFENAQQELLKLQTKLTDESQQHELRCRHLEEHVSGLLLEKQDHLVGFDRERQQCLRQHQDEKVKLLRFVQEVRGLHRLLQLTVVEAREHLNNEVKTTKDTLEAIHQQASEFAVRQSDREVALVSRKGRILQLETQLKNDRQTINQLEATLAKSTRLLEKKNATLKAKLEEQKEHLEITLAVRQGLTNDLQTKRKQVAELEKEVARLALAKGKTDVKLKHAQQQIHAMRKVHAHELETLSKKASCMGKSLQAQLSDPARKGNNESKTLKPEGPEEPEWREFVELTAAYEAERQLHAGTGD